MINDSNCASRPPEGDHLGTNKQDMTTVNPEVTIKDMLGVKTKVTNKDMTNAGSRPDEAKQVSV